MTDKERDETAEKVIITLRDGMKIGFNVRFGENGKPNDDDVALIADRIRCIESEDGSHIE